MKAARPTTKADETPEFLDFWNTWQPVMHKNDGRGSARDEFFRHVEVRGADPRDIADGAKWYVYDGGNREYKLHAQTWLNRRAYEDGADRWRKHQARMAEIEASKSSNVVALKQPPKSKFLQEWARREAQS